MSNRRIALAFDNEKDDMKSIETSISQGSSILPILFLLYLSPLFDKIKSQYSSALLLSYIDDVSILVLNEKVKQNTRMLEDKARTAFEWAHDKVITFDDSKSELIYFENTHKISNKTVRLINSTTMHATECVRWLRVWFDRKLKFNKHVKQKKASMLRAFNVIQNLLNSERELIRDAMR
jgi:hypothetical protein